MENKVLMSETEDTKRSSTQKNKWFGYLKPRLGPDFINFDCALLCSLGFFIFQIATNTT